MKHVLTLAIFLSLLYVAPTLAATYTSVKAGNWTDPTTWGTATAPGASDIVNIDHKVTVVANYTGNSGSAINIRSGGTLFVTAGWIVTGQDTNITVNTGGTIDVAGTLSIENKTKIALSGGQIKAGTLSMPDNNSSSGITYTSGTVQVTTGNLYVGYSATFSYSPNLSIPGSVTLRNASTLNLTAMTGSINIEKGSVINLVSGSYSPTSISMVDAGSTLKLKTGSLTYGNALTLTKGSLLIDGGTYTQNNTLTLDNGSTFTVAAGASATIGTASTNSQVNFTRVNTGGVTFANDGTTKIWGDASISGAVTNMGTLTITRDYTQQNVGGGMTNSGVFNVDRDTYAYGVIQLNPGATSTMTVGRELYIDAGLRMIVGTTISGTCNTSITQYANLVVKGNLNLTGSGDVTVRQNGRFVAFGNITTNGTGNDVTIDCGGQAYVGGNISLGLGGGNTVTNSNSGSSPSGSDGQPRIGLYVNGTTTAQHPPSTSGTLAQFKANDLPFFTFVSGLPGSPLPVKIQYFEVSSVTEHGVALEWATSMEKNFSHFEVQSAGTDLQFGSIGIVQGRGGLQVKTVYEWLDQSPANGKNYYRLKAVDLDNSVAYFSVIMTDWSGDNNGLSLYPNPAIDRSFTIDLGDEYDQSVNLEVYESKGTIVYAGAPATKTSSVKLPETIPAGVYFVRVSSQSKQQVVRLVVK